MNRTQIFRSLYIIAFCIFIAACSSTDTTIFRNPDFKDKRFTKVCVLAAIDDLNMRRKVENEIAINLQQYNVYAIPTFTVIAPNADLSEEQLIEQLKKEGFDCIIHTSIVIQYTKTTVIPASMTTTTTTATKEKKKDDEVKPDRKKDDEKRQDEITTVKKTVYETAKENIKLYTEFLTRIIDSKTGKNAWMATTKTSSGEWNYVDSKAPAVIESFAADIVEKMITDNLFLKTKF